MDPSWLYTSFESVIMALLSTVGIYAILIICTRLAGLRSFSKLSSFDFAITIAIGSLVASTILFESPSLFTSASALVCLFLIQVAVGILRRKSAFARNIFDNKAILLMKGDTIIEENMKKAKVSRADLLAKLRESNVLKFDQVYAVVMESTGDISVLHHDMDEVDFDTALLDDLEEEYRQIGEEKLSSHVGEDENP